MTRRTFVPSALAAASGAAQPSRLRAGFLGGNHPHAPAKIKMVQTSPRFDLAGVVEDDPKLRAALEQSGVRALTRDQLLGDRSIVAVIVESQAKDHARDALDALRAGKHVHVEKPPADSMDGFREMVVLARDRKLLLQMGYMWRYNPAAQAAIDAARKGWLGDIYFVRANMCTQLDAERRLDWAPYRGGQMFDLNCHLIDIVVRLMGRPTKVTPFLRSHGGFGDHMKDNTVAVFEWPRALGIVTGAAMQANAFAYRAIEILGTNGTASIRPIEPPTLTIDLAKPAGPYAAGKQNVPMPRYQRYVPELEEFANAIQAGKPLSFTAGEDLLVHETLLRASDML